MRPALLPRVFTVCINNSDNASKCILAKLTDDTKMGGENLQGEQSPKIVKYPIKLGFLWDVTKKKPM